MKTSPCSAILQLPPSPQPPARLLLLLAGALQRLHHQPGALVVLDVGADLANDLGVAVAVQVVVLDLSRTGMERKRTSISQQLASCRWVSCIEEDLIDTDEMHTVCGSSNWLQFMAQRAQRSRACAAHLEVLPHGHADLLGQLVGGGVAAKEEHWQKDGQMFAEHTRQGISSASL